jgi:hypothetical protein
MAQKGTGGLGDPTVCAIHGRFCTGLTSGELMMDLFSSVATALEAVQWPVEVCRIVVKKTR